MIEKVVSAALEVMRKELGDTVLIEDEYPMAEMRVTKPVLYTECTGFERADNQPANGMFAINASFETRISSPVSVSAKQRKKTRQLATKIAMLLEGNSFAIENGEFAKVKSAYDDGLDPEVPTVESWSILWEMKLMLGQGEEEESGIPYAKPHEYWVQEEERIGS